MYNDTLVAYDLTTKATKIIPIPGVTHTSTDNFTNWHVDGIDYDPGTGHIFVAASNAEAFLSILSPGPGNTLVTNYSNANYTGPNRVLVFDPQTDTFLFDVSTAPAQNEFQHITGHLTNGFQDMAEIVHTHDSYAIGTFGNSIVRIPYQSNISELWYAPTVYNATYGFGGIVSYDYKLLVSDAISGGFVVFDTREEDPQPVYVPLQGLPSDYRPPNADGVYTPAKYCGNIALWSDDYNGTAVYGTNDGWQSAYFIGLISNNDPGVYEGSLTTDSFELQDRVYVVTQFFVFDLPARPVKNFPLYDITDELEAIVQSSQFSNGTTCRSSAT